MNKVIVFFLASFLLFVKLSICQTNWFQQVSNTVHRLYSIQFLDYNTGYICGGDSNSVLNVFIKSTDGGNNWALMNFGVPARSIYFINIDTGYMCGTSGEILKTTNGLNFIVQNSNTSYDLRSIYFSKQNNLIGFACGDHGTMVKTTNGGTNWYLMTSGTTQPLYSIYFINLNTGFCVGNTFLKSTNGGLDWIYVPTGSPGGINYSINFYNDTIGYISSIPFNLGDNYNLKTTNSGLNWFVQNGGTGLSIFFQTSNIGYVVGLNGNISKTTNGGSNWFIQNSGTTRTLRSVYFIDQNTGWAVGDSGIILHTTNGGGPIGIKPISRNVPDKFNLEQNYPNPFNPSTNIKYQIAKNSYVSLRVYDILSHEVAVLVNENLTTGTYEVQWNASNYPSGVYFYKLVTSNYEATKKMILVK